MKRYIILFLLAFLIMAFFGYKLGQSRAKDNISKRMSLKSKVIGGWKYFYSGQHTAGTEIASFLMATQEVLGGTHEQSLFLIADRDADGDEINSNYQYVVEGGNIPAECWNLSVYDPDYLIENVDERYFVSSSMITPVVVLSNSKISEIHGLLTSNLG